MELVEPIIRLATAIIIVAIITKLFIIIFTAFASFWNSITIITGTLTFNCKN